MIFYNLTKKNKKNVYFNKLIINRKKLHSISLNYTRNYTLQTKLSKCMIRTLNYNIGYTLHSARQLCHYFWTTSWEKIQLSIFSILEKQRRNYTLPS